MLRKHDDVEEVKFCPECKSSVIIRDYTHAEVVCNNCGFVIEEQQIDFGPDWRSFESDGKATNAHAGSPRDITLPDYGLMTRTGDWDRDFLNWRVQMDVSGCRNLDEAMKNMKSLAATMNLPRSVLERSAFIYRKALEKNFVQGRSIRGVVAASVYAACRLEGIPRMLDDVSEASRVGRKEIGRIYRFIARRLRLSAKPTDPASYLDQLCSRLHLGMTVETEAARILRDATQRELISGRAPTGIAAAALYIATLRCGEQRTQKEIAKVAKVSEVTVRNRSRELAGKLGIETGHSS